MTYSRGKYAYGYCDRTGLRYPIDDLIEEVRNGVPTGLRVGRDVFDRDHPQNFVGRLGEFIHDPQALSDPRPDQSLEESRSFFSYNPVGLGPSMIASVGTVRVD